MPGPVPTSILNKWELLDDVFGHMLVEQDKNGKTRSGDEDMGRFERDLVAWHSNAIRCQVLLDREV